MNKLKLFRNSERPKIFQGMEIYPGRYRGSSKNEDSVYIDHEAFDFIKAPFVVAVPQFLEYGRTEISKPEAVRLIEELEALLVNLDEPNPWEKVEFDPIRRKHFVDHNASKLPWFNEADLKEMIQDFINWLRTELKSNDGFTFHGL